MQNVFRFSFVLVFSTLQTMFSQKGVARQKKTSDKNAQSELERVKTLREYLR